jgi:hypothetical protein
MKIELDVDPGQLGKSLTDILGALSADEKKALATRTMESWLRAPEDVERITRDRWAIERVREETKGNHYYKDQTDEQIRREHRYESMMRGWRSSKEEMVDGITRQVIEFYKAEVKQAVETDPRIQAMKAEVVKVMLETFPKLAYDAMVVHVASSFQKLMDDSQTLGAKMGSLEQHTQGITKRLLEIGSMVGH